MSSQFFPKFLDGFLWAGTSENGPAREKIYPASAKKIFLFFYKKGLTGHRGCGILYSRGDKITERKKENEKDNRNNANQLQV